ncbi:MAG: DsrE family protein [Nitrospirae bacterium]|nr:DsrE family protein [Nitrospirota bacterium]
MEKKKFIFILNHATSNPMEVIGLMKIASNMKAFDDTIELDFFLLGEGVQLAKKGLAKTISIEMEGAQVNIGELLDVVSEFGVKFYVCQAFMPGFGVTKESLIENALVKSSSYLGELLLNGYVPFSLNM